jgi:D-glycero-alpha-D-manno-heptose 1-phosphate guanylyltransferase
VSAADPLVTQRPAADRASAIDQAVILAGGLGTRLRSVVSDVPKPMAPVAGRPFLEHQMDFWADQGIRRFVLSVAYLGETIVAHFGNRYRGCDIEYAVEETPLGTGGGVLLSAQRVVGEGPFLLLNGDTFFQVELSRLAAYHERAGSDWTVALFRPDEAGRYGGVELAPDGRILSFLDKSAAAGKLANGGVYLVNPRVLAGMASRPPRKCSLETDLMPELLAGARVHGLECPGRFLDIGVPEDYARAAEFVSARSST